MYADTEKEVRKQATRIYHVKTIKQIEVRCLTNSDVEPNKFKNIKNDLTGIFESICEGETVIIGF